MSSDTVTTIEAYGSTTLVQRGSNYFLNGTDGSSVELSYGGAPVVTGQFSAYGFDAPMAAEKTASGYEVAWKDPGATSAGDQYTIWYVDNSGNYLSSAFNTALGSSSQLESFETSFQQDLNGDGSIGVPNDNPSFIYQGVDANGVQLYNVSWKVYLENDRQFQKAYSLMNEAKKMADIFK